MNLIPAQKTFLEPTYLDNQFWFWKVSLIFSFLIWSNLGPFLNFLGLSGLFFGLGSDSKNLLLPTYIDNQLWFWKYSHIFLFSIWPHLGPFLHFFGPFGAIFWPFGAYCVVGVRFKNIFGTYLCRQSTLVLESQPHLFIFNLVIFGAFFTFLGLSRLFLGWRSGSKTFLEPTNVDYQFLFWKYSPIFLFSIRQNWTILGKMRATLLTVSSIFYIMQISHFWNSFKTKIDSLH